MQRKMGKKFNIRFNKQLTNMEKVELNDEVLIHIDSNDPLISVGDEYHDIHALYEHRMALNLALFHALDKLYKSLPLEDKGIHPRVFKAKNHHPENGPMFQGYFIVFCCVAEWNGAWTSYHYKLEHWDKFDIPVTNYSPLFPNNHEDSIEFFGRMKL
jgi:hypothetical protein